MLYFLLFAVLIFLVGACRWGLALRRSSGAQGVQWTSVDLVAVAGLIAAALFSVRPYLHAGTVGSGDSYHYGLQVADFVTQLRHGVMPIFVGQSEYAFNGNIHTLRTAPYFTHLAGLIDLLTMQRLSFVRLQNLTVVVSAVAAALTAFVIARRVSGGRRLAPALLAAIYVTSPAILGPIAIGDMFATYMTAPWLLVCWYGVSELFRRTDDGITQLVTVGGLAALWYAHPPIAGWLSLVWATAQVGRIIASAGAPGQWRRQALAGLLLLALNAYLFVSVATVHAPAPAITPPEFYSFDASSLQSVLHSAFPAFDGTREGTAGIQLGWTLWSIFVGAFIVLLRRKIASGIFIFLISMWLLLLLIPVPWLSFAAWHLAPERLIAMTIWPDQRLYPILAAGIVVATALALRGQEKSGTRFYPLACGILCVGLGWNLQQASAIHHRTVAQNSAVSEARYRPENLILTRYSYALSGKEPAYFSNSWMDPEFESRILDKELDSAQDNAREMLSLPASAKATSHPLSPSARLQLSGPASYLLTFDFTDSSSKGEVTLRGAGIDRAFTLPRSGGPLAFGSESDCSKSIPVRLSAAGESTIEVVSSVPGTSVRVIPFDSNALPIRVTSETPYRASLRASQAGYLETPKVFLEGYAATVNGQSVPVRISPDRLVAVPIPAGDSHVEVTYVGPPWLRRSWVLSLAVLAGLPWIGLISVRAASRGTVTPDFNFAWIKQHNLLRQLQRITPRQIASGVAISAIVAAVGWGVLSVYRHRVASTSFGSLRVGFEISRRPDQKSEPLVVIGTPGKADCIYVVYEGPQTVRFGFDHWAVGGPLSDPVQLGKARQHTLELTIGGLYPKSAQSTPVIRDLFKNPKAAPFKLTVDGKVIFDRILPYYPASPTKVAIGSNPVGSSVCGPEFSGRILSTERFVPGF
jgi:hypothetical protein